MRTILLAACLLFACGKKKQEDAPPAPPAPPATTETTALAADAAAAPASIALGDGERYFGGTRTDRNAYEWKLADGTTLQLVVVALGDPTDGKQEGVLRLYRGGKSAEVGRKFQVATNGDHWAEIKQLANGRVLFRHGDASEGGRARNVALLEYDAASGEIRIVKRWVGAAKTTEPSWAASGEYKAEGGADACKKVVARLAACANDEAFRAALFAREDEPARAEHLARFDADAKRWSKPSEVSAQCERWRSAEYVDTTLGEPDKLERLAKEATAPKVSCEFFGREIVDEGGLPQLAAKR